ncbi:hypothetical protein L2Y94_14535 [Luteibacter aegosomatis]|uniref:hypothetical protein n=1 Tax=Luteibacter aegosomatis TaxID=2911537 RepID=UPI001FFB1990|nr:hypothetical protein [Luteibacter aegosomatis]UPG84546.1 hypothetical protein L2Y94_14535 [Luteibacter aegosomatis]
MLIFVGLPFLAVLLWFFLRFQVRALTWMFPRSLGRRVAMVLLTSLTVFGFFCLGGIAGYGETSHRLSIAFIVCLAPISACLGIIRTWRGSSASRYPSALREALKKPA